MTQGTAQVYAQVRAERVRELAGAIKSPLAIGS